MWGGKEEGRGVDEVHVELCHNYFNYGNYEARARMQWTGPRAFSLPFGP